MKKLLTVLLSFGISLSAQTILQPKGGGTGNGTYAIGDILYATSPGTLSRLPVGSAGKIITMSGGLPSWQTPAPAAASTLTGTVINSSVVASSLTSVGTVTAGIISTTVTPLASASLTIAATTTINGSNNFLTNISAASSTLTAVTFAYSNIPDGGQVSIDYLKTTASNTVLTFPAGSTISQSCNGIVSGLTLTLVSTALGEFELTIIRRGSNYKIYLAQDIP